FADEHEELRESVRNFVSKEIAPHVEEWEDAREFPRELYNRCGELGFLGLKYETEYGGQGGDYVHDAVSVEELSRSAGSRRARPRAPTGRAPPRRSGSSGPRSRSSAGWFPGSRAS